MRPPVAGWFSIRCIGASAGDFLVRDLACNWLFEAGHTVDVALADSFTGGVRWHLPKGEGLFAVRTVDEAVAAIESILADPELHGRRARDIAAEYLDGVVVMRSVLEEVGRS